MPKTMTDQEIRDLAAELLDEGVNPSTIRATLTVLITRDPSTPPVAQLVREATNEWLTRAEARMRALAAEGSWQRLEALLVKYQKVT